MFAFITITNYNILLGNIFSIERIFYEKLFKFGMSVLRKKIHRK